MVVAGKQAEKIPELLLNKNYVNEFIIAKKLEITINQARNILYKISDYGLVSSIRKKDKKKGWYTYFWKIEVLKCLEFLKNILVKQMTQINYWIKSREEKGFYVCERCSREFTEENALLHNFICDECGDVFTVKDNKKVLKEFNKELDKLKKELSLVEAEIKKEKEKIEKAKIREAKKIEKNKPAKKTKTVKKKTVKKPTKKKVTKKKATKNKTSKSKKSKSKPAVKRKSSTVKKRK